MEAVASGAGITRTSEQSTPLPTTAAVGTQARDKAAVPQPTQGGAAEATQGLPSNDSIAHAATPASVAAAPATVAEQAPLESNDPAPAVTDSEPAASYAAADDAEAPETTSGNTKEPMADEAPLPAAQVPMPDSLQQEAPPLPHLVVCLPGVETSNIVQSVNNGFFMEGL
jgi:hypothetical protein